MDWRTILIIGHILGTILGAGGATFAELFSLKSLASGKFDETASSYLHTTFTVIRIGMLLLVLSGFGLLLLARLTGHPEFLYSPRLWAKLIIILVILGNALLMQSRGVPLWLGSAVSLTSWYAAFIIGAWRMQASLTTILFVYILATIVVASVLEVTRRVIRKPA